MRADEGQLRSNLDRRDLVLAAGAAFDRLVTTETPEVEEKHQKHSAEEERLEERISLNDRLRFVITAVRELGATSVVDVGCGEGKLLRVLLQEKQLERFVAREPLRRVHECAFAVLALESEPVDPRL